MNNKTFRADVSDVDIVMDAKKILKELEGRGLNTVQTEALRAVTQSLTVLEYLL